MRYINILILFFFIGCSYKTTPITFAFKKDNIAINDQGFLKENSFLKKIEVYNVGQLAFIMTINSKNICINNKCYDKKIFLYQLNPKYPTNLFNLIISKKRLPNIKIIKIKDGFIQKNEDIYYFVNKNRVFFKDKSNKFLFLLKKTKI